MTAGGSQAELLRVSPAGAALSFVALWGGGPRPGRPDWRISQAELPPRPPGRSWTVALVECAVARLALRGLPALLRWRAARALLCA